MKIEFQNVTFGYQPNQDILKDVSFVIDTNQMTAIIGPNGSGKSTIAKLMMGLLEVNSGKILIDDVELNQKTQASILKKMGIIFQNPDNQFVGVTVLDDIAFGLENKQVPKIEMERLITKYASLVKMEKYLNANPENLSGGQKQRVAIAGVLAMETETIIFDEATSMLDPVGTKEINETLKMLKKQANKTIITITHNIEEILYSDQVLVIHDGTVTKYDSPKQFLMDNQYEKYHLDTIDTVKLINKLDSNKHEGLIKALWELTFKI